MEYRVKAKAKCVYKNVLYKAGEEFTFDAESERGLPDYVEVLFVNDAQVVSAASDTTGIAISPVNAVSDTADKAESSDNVVNNAADSAKNVTETDTADNAENGEETAEEAKQKEETLLKNNAAETKQNEGKVKKTGTKKNKNK